MTGNERTIRRELRRSGIPIHACRRTARRLAAQAEVDATLASLQAFVGRRSGPPGADIPAERAAQQGAAMGAAVALTFLDLGRWIGTGIDRLQAHVNKRPG
ncbi:hypothetical protein MKK84_15945 [Methylobacterium sp. E-065]|uniref:hypothetical protein n=1 Tax=Methylobacterium sp. E-065 TaxID=2836583 RepID=UPI001FB9B7E1|nr:hypothetical protein [Methylobacterium sp. E-065]MCJ2018916.1 hypothetical protein [Methylobacterium sp. E-065]